MKEQKPKPRKKPATPQGDFWDAVRMKEDQLTDDEDAQSKDLARLNALSAFLLRGTERVYIRSRTTGEEIDLTADMRKVEAEYKRRRIAGDEIDPDGGELGELEDIIRTVLPEVTLPKFDDEGAEIISTKGGSA